MLPCMAAGDLPPLAAASSTTKSLFVLSIIHKYLDLELKTPLRQQSTTKRSVESENSWKCILPFSKATARPGVRDSVRVRKLCQIKMQAAIACTIEIRLVIRAINKDFNKRHERQTLGSR